MHFGACCVDGGYLILLPSPRETDIWGLYSKWVGVSCTVGGASQLLLTLLMMQLFISGLLKGSRKRVTGYNREKCLRNATPIPVGFLDTRFAYHSCRTTGIHDFVPRQVLHFAKFQLQEHNYILCAWSKEADHLDCKFYLNKSNVTLFFDVKK